MISITVKNLIHLLNSEGIVYCHWKSNAALNRSADGRNDLDLLIERCDAARFKQCVFKLGFKHAQAPYGPARIAGIDDFFGFDFELGRFIHVQAHYCLVLGHDATKNYRLPVERPFLASRSQDQRYGFPIPSPEWELVIFCFRMILKFSLVSAALKIRYELSPNPLNELNYLKDRVNQEKIDEILADYFPFVEKALFDYCLQTLTPGTSKRQWVVARFRLRSKFDGVSLRGPIHTAWLGGWRHLINAIRLRMGLGALKRAPMEGGLVVAIIGDNPNQILALTGALENWLGKAYPVRTIALLPTDGNKKNTDGGSNSERCRKLSFVLEKSRIIREMIIFGRMRRARRLAAKGVIVLLSVNANFPLSLTRQSLPLKSDNGADQCLNPYGGQFESYYAAKGIAPDLILVQPTAIENSSSVPSQPMKPSTEEHRITQPLVTYLEAGTDAVQRAKQLVWENL